MNAFLRAVEERIARERMEALTDRAREDRPVKPGREAENARRRARRQHARSQQTTPGAGTRFKVHLLFGNLVGAREALAQCAPRYRRQLMEWAEGAGHAEAVRGVMP